MCKSDLLKLLLCGVLSAGSVTPAFAKSKAAGIVRNEAAQPGPILSSITIPPGAETLLLSGIVPSPIDPVNRANLEAFGDTQTQATNVFKKIEAELTRQGWTMQDVVKLQVFLVGDPRLEGRMDFAGLNASYKQYFGTAANPNLVARSTMQIAGLANPFFLVEIEATAARIAARR